MTWRCRRPAPDLADDGEDDVLAVTPGGSAPSTLTRMFSALHWISVGVAEHMLDLGEVPMPCASAPKAPRVEVWLSLYTMVVLEPTRSG